MKTLGNRQSVGVDEQLHRMAEAIGTLAAAGVGMTSTQLSLIRKEIQSHKLEQLAVNAQPEEKIINLGDGNKQLFKKDPGTIAEIQKLLILNRHSFFRSAKHLLRKRLFKAFTFHWIGRNTLTWFAKVPRIMIDLAMEVAIRTGDATMLEKLVGEHLKEYHGWLIDPHRKMVVVINLKNEVGLKKAGYYLKEGKLFTTHAEK